MSAEERIKLKRHAQQTERDQELLMQFEHEFPGQTPRQIKDQLRDLQKLVQILKDKNFSHLAGK